MENIIAGLILLILGGCMFVCTNAMVRFQVWSQRAVMGAEYIPSKRTYTVMRLIGVLLIILGLVVVTGILK
jgi:uncharacterized membrane protein YkgB